MSFSTCGYELIETHTIFLDYLSLELSLSSKLLHANVIIVRKVVRKVVKGAVKRVVKKGMILNNHCQTIRIIELFRTLSNEDSASSEETSTDATENFDLGGRLRQRNRE